MERIMKFKKGKEWGHIKKHHKKANELEKEGLMGLDSKPKTLTGEKNKLEKEGVNGARP
jgi:hypothetical protein